MSAVLPWHQVTWQQLIRRQQQGQLPHALMLSGTAGMGKLRFARSLAEALLCQSPQASSEACGQCSACQLMHAGTHPDYKLIEPEEPGKAIKVDQIRSLIEYMSLSSHASGPRVILIQPADAMNISAANSLLKTLEEPSGSTVMILVTDRPASLPATIRSRCQVLRMPSASREQAKQWLAEYSQLDGEAATRLLNIANSAPFIALQMAENGLAEVYESAWQDWLNLASGNADPLKTAEQWLKVEQHWPIYWAYEWVMGMIRIKLSAEQSDKLPNDSQLEKVTRPINIKQLYGLLDKVAEALRFVHTQANQLMLLEGILIYWFNLAHQKAK